MVVPHTFLGPVFIVGMPRSGTKLMRTLLNQHPDISITLAESHFIPYFIKTFGNPPPFHTEADFRRFMEKFSRTTFCRGMRRAGYQFHTQEFLATVDWSSWASIFEQLFRHFSAKPDRQDVIWGDKTPGYIKHMPLLQQLYPQAKFLHMIRDPRDYCLSVRTSWGKSLYRAAHRWKETIETARHVGKQLGDNYLEVFYEDLLSDPEKVMRTIADFLGCPYHASMVTLGKSPEDFGETKGQYGIVRDNAHKYHKRLSIQQIRRIEEIVCPVAVPLKYDMDNDVRHKPLRALYLAGYKLYDGIIALRHHILMERHMLQGVQRLVNHYTKSSWR